MKSTLMDSTQIGFSVTNGTINFVGEKYGVVTVDNMRAEGMMHVYNLHNFDMILGMNFIEQFGSLCLIPKNQTIVSVKRQENTTETLLDLSAVNSQSKIEKTRLRIPKILQKRAAMLNTAKQCIMQSDHHKLSKATMRDKDSQTDGRSSLGIEQPVRTGTLFLEFTNESNELN